MKKLLSIALALVIVLSMGTAAFAEDYEDMSTVTLTKEYVATNTGTTSPAETFTFTKLVCTGVKDAGVGVTTATAPVPTIASVTYAAGDAGSANAEKDITISLPKYEAVGIYTYTFSEIAGNTAGVTYYSKPIILVVTVIEQNGKVRVAAVHTEAEGENKSDEFENEYSAGSLSVAKVVEGNMGDLNKEFTVKVTFTAPKDKVVKEDITYLVGTEEKTIAPADWKDGKAEVEITLKSGSTITFDNIPYGVTYTVVENDYTAEGYKATYAFDDDAKIIDSESESVTITNTKEGEVDTGVFMDTMPYVLILALAGAGFALLVSRKAKREF